jgi:hypothetical protein
MANQNGPVNVGPVNVEPVNVGPVNVEPVNVGPVNVIEYPRTGVQASPGLASMIEYERYPHGIKPNGTRVIPTGTVGVSNPPVPLVNRDAVVIPLTGGKRKRKNKSKKSKRKKSSRRLRHRFTRNCSKKWH